MTEERLKEALSIARDHADQTIVRANKLSDDRKAPEWIQKALTDDANAIHAVCNALEIRLSSTTEQRGDHQVDERDPCPCEGTCSNRWDQQHYCKQLPKADEVENGLAPEGWPDGSTLEVCPRCAWLRTDTQGDGLEVDDEGNGTWRCDDCGLELPQPKGPAPSYKLPREVPCPSGHGLMRFIPAVVEALDKE